MATTKCPYCKKEYDSMKSCKCRCRHSVSMHEPICDKCIEAQLKKLKPGSDLKPSNGAGRQTACGPAFTRFEKERLNNVLKENA